MPHDASNADESELHLIVDSIVNSVSQRLELQRLPCATYRVQFNCDFTFQDARHLVPYWNDLGITHCYTSPYLKANAGSRHGYDIVDHSRLNPELGSEEDFQSFISELRRHEMGHVQDFVPNHMGIAGNENMWFQDVLENGPSSRYATFFDIDWHPLKTDLEFKVLLPVLGSQFGRALEDQHLQLTFCAGAFQLRYFDRCFPIEPRSYAIILEQRLDELAGCFTPSDPHLLEYMSILTAISHLPQRHEIAPAKGEERSREKEAIKRRLQRLCAECVVVADFIANNVVLINGQRDRPRTFDLLDQLLQEQAYRLSFWRVAADEINYRRFFDVNELAAICMERQEVFEEAHQLVFRLLDYGHVDGLRIDHADGLFDPTAYLWQLQERRFLQRCRSEFESRIQLADGDPITWPEAESVLKERFAELRSGPTDTPVLRSLYLIVEKILERTEELPTDWPVHGTTGYEFLNCVNGLFVDSGKIARLDAVYAKFISRKLNFEEIVYEAKRLILKVSMSSELHVLGHQLDRISEGNRWTRDFTRHGLIQALREVVACFPVYRTYTVGRRVLDRDRTYIERAVCCAKQRNPAVSGEVFDFIRSVLLHEDCDDISVEEMRLRQEFIGRFQQFTGPLMAKSVEDTAFYRFHRLISLNEVGGLPESSGVSVREFHQRNLERQRHRPHGMLTTSTHDTKRSEDVRARINVLSEIPDDWKNAVFRWTKWNQNVKQMLDGAFAPSRNDEYLLYQTLIGAWPLVSPNAEELREFVQRIQQYMMKAIREAKEVSSWITPNDAYERATHAFIETILRASTENSFRRDFESFAQRVIQVGLWNSLSQTLLKLTSPGVPDIYQGTELWDFSLVDPDNRRPVDYAVRRDAVHDVLWDTARESDDGKVFARQLVDNARDGRIKLFVIAKALRMRRLYPEVFDEGEYIPLEACGHGRDHLCAFARRHKNIWSITIVPRLVAGMLTDWAVAPIGASCWSDTKLTLPQEFATPKFRNVFTDAVIATHVNRELPVTDLLSDFPIALLVNER